MEGWVNRSFQYFSLEKAQDEFEKAQQWDGYKNYVVNQDGYVMYTFDRKSSIRLDDLLWFISIGFIRISGWQCVNLMKELIDKYKKMEKQKITHGNLSLQTIWLVFNIPKGGQLNFDYRYLEYKVHFTGYSVNPQQQMGDDKAMIIVFHSILGIMQLLQTDVEKQIYVQRKETPFIETIQANLYSALNRGLDFTHKQIEEYLSYQSKPLQHFKQMDQKFHELIPVNKELRANIIKQINTISSEQSNDMIFNLTIDYFVRNQVISILSTASLFKGKEKAKSQEEQKNETDLWKKYMLCPPEIQKEVKEKIEQYDSDMNAELGSIFKFETKVPIPDLNQWIQEQIKRFWLLALIESQCLNSCSQFNHFIQSGKNIDYKSMKQKILKEYSIIHEKAFEKIIEDLINTLQ